MRTHRQFVTAAGSAADKNPNTPKALVDALRDLNPWVDNADLDHHGFGSVTATKTGLDVDMVRTQTIKKKTTKTIAGDDFRYKIARGQTSIKGVNGPPAKQQG